MGKNFNNLLWNHEAYSLYIEYVAMFSGPLHNPANQAPEVQAGLALEVISSHRIIMEKKLKKSSVLKPWGSYISYVAMFSGPLHKSC